MLTRLLSASVLVMICAAAAGAQTGPGAPPPPVLRGLLFIDGSASPSASALARPDPDGLDVSRVPALADGRIRQVLAGFVGQPFTVDALTQIREQVGAHFSRLGRPFVRVTIPPQEAADGIVRVVVTEGRLGAVTVAGARYFAEQDYLDAVDLEAGSAIDAHRLNRGIAWLNSNPYRQVTPVARAGQAVGTTDLVLQVQERRPVAVGGSIGNTGNPRNGELQIGTSFDWGNAFGRGDLLNVRYMTSQDRVINQVGGGYVAQLPGRDSLSVNGSYARTRPDAAGSDVSNEGVSSGASARYGLRTTRFADRLAIGVDYRRTDNDVLFGGESIFAAAAVVAQIAVDYSKGMTSRLGVSHLLVTAIYSPGDLSSANSDAAFEAQRAGATSRYGYLRAAWSQSGLLPGGWNWDLRANVQAATAKLLSTEQMGFGGDGSVRGFDTFAANRDEGVTVNAEMRLPSLRGILKGTRRDGDADDLSLFVFADYATGRQHGEDIGPLRMASVGPGLRYRLGRFVTTQLAYGHVLQDAGVADAPASRFHFQLIAGF